MKTKITLTDRDLAVLERAANIINDKTQIDSETYDLLLDHGCQPSSVAAMLWDIIVTCRILKGQSQ